MKIWIFVSFAAMNFAIPGLSYSETARGGGEDGGTVGPSTLRISLDSDDGQFSHDTTRSEISADGRYVAFIAKVPISYPVVFRHDLLTGAVEEVSIDSEGSRLSISESLLAISADGRYVVFHMRSTGIYIRDMNAGVNEFIDIPTTDGEPPNYIRNFSITPDARIIAFTSEAANLVPGECSIEYELGNCAYVFDRDANIVERVSVAYDGTPQDFASSGPRISADGRYVAFFSSATNLVPDDTNGVFDVFVHDRDTGFTERVSVASDGTENNGELTLSYSISADGRYIAFGSTATNLVPDDTNGGGDVFVRDRVTGTTERVSVASDGAQGNGPSSTLSTISADGRFVAFDSWASNLVPDDTNDTSDHFLHDRLTGVTERISVRTDGTEGNRFSIGITSISADNRFVTFSSHAALVPDDTNGKGDIYVRDRGGEPPDGPVPAFVPSSVGFGTVEVGTTSTSQNATLTNFGGGDATGLSFNDPGSGFDADTADCGDTLPAGESCQVTVTFSPAAPGPAGSTLTVDSDQGATTSLNLTGDGRKPPPNPIFEDHFEQGGKP